MAFALWALVAALSLGAVAWGPHRSDDPIPVENLPAGQLSLPEPVRCTNCGDPPIRLEDDTVPIISIEGSRVLAKCDGLAAIEARLARIEQALAELPRMAFPRGGIGYQEFFDLPAEAGTRCINCGWYRATPPPSGPAGLETTR